MNTKCWVILRITLLVVIVVPTLAQSEITLMDELPDISSGTLVGAANDNSGTFFSGPIGTGLVYYEFMTPSEAHYLDIIVQSANANGCDWTVRVGMHEGSPYQAQQVFMSELWKGAVSLVNDGIYCTKPSNVKLGAKHVANVKRYLLLTASAPTHSFATVSDNSTCSVQVSYKFRSEGELLISLFIIFIPVTVVLLVCLLSWLVLKRLQQEDSQRNIPSYEGTIRALPICITDNLLRYLTTLLDTFRQGMRKRQRLSSYTVQGEELEEGDDGLHTCRICKENATSEELVAPCECTGSCRYVHQSCIDRWRLESVRRNSQYSTHCEICTARFQTPVRRSTLDSSVLKRLVRLTLLLASIVVIAFLTSTLLTAVIGQSSCFDSYHQVDYRSIYSLNSLVFGGIWYFIFTFSLHHSQLLIGRLCLPCWLQCALALLLSFVPQLLVVLMGYALRYVLYRLVDGTVWTWETSPEAGVFVVAVLCAGCIIIAALRVLMLQFTDPSRDGEEAEGVTDTMTVEQQRQAANADV